MSGTIVAFPARSVGRADRPGILSRSRDALAHLAREWRLRRDLRALQSLDRRGLHDIGLGPGSLEGAVRYGRRSRPPESPVSTPIGVEAPLMPPSWTEWR